MRHDRDDRQRPPLPGAGHMEDYTKPFLVSACVLVFIALVAIKAVFGMLAALGVAYVADRFLVRN